MCHINQIPQRPIFLTSLVVVKAPPDEMTGTMSLDAYRNISSLILDSAMTTATTKVLITAARLVP